jgi:hypothetical protein
MDRRFEALMNDMNRRFEAVDQRLDLMNARLDQIILMLANGRKS